MKSPSKNLDSKKPSEAFDLSQLIESKRLFIFMFILTLFGGCKKDRMEVGSARGPQSIDVDDFRFERLGNSVAFTIIRPWSENDVHTLSRDRVLTALKVLCPNEPDDSLNHQLDALMNNLQEEIVCDSK